MKKIIVLALLLSCTVVSCGKKGDPVYVELKKKVTIKSISLYKA